MQETKKEKIMKNSMRQLTQLAVCLLAVLSVVACSSDDVAQDNNTKQKPKTGVATFTG